MMKCLLRIEKERYKRLKLLFLFLPKTKTIVEEREREGCTKILSFLFRLCLSDERKLRIGENVRRIVSVCLPIDQSFCPLYSLSEQRERSSNKNCFHSIETSTFCYMTRNDVNVKHLNEIKI